MLRNSRRSAIAAAILGSSLAGAAQGAMLSISQTSTLPGGAINLTTQGPAGWVKFDTYHGNGGTLSTNPGNVTMSGGASMSLAWTGQGNNAESTGGVGWENGGGYSSGFTWTNGAGTYTSTDTSPSGDGEKLQVDDNIAATSPATWAVTAPNTNGGGDVDTLTLYGGYYYSTSTLSAVLYDASGNTLATASGATLNYTGGSNYEVFTITYSGGDHVVVTDTMTGYGGGGANQYSSIAIAAATLSAATPEPASLGLFGAASMLLLKRRRRSRSASASAGRGTAAWELR